MRRTVTNDVSDIVGASPRPLRPFAERILTRHADAAFLGENASAAETDGGGAARRPPSPEKLRCVDPMNPTYPLSWVQPSDADKKRAVRAKGSGAMRPNSAAAARPPTPTEGWRTNKLDVRDITTTMQTRPRSADVRRRVTGSRSFDYSDVPRSTALANAHRHLNFTRRTDSYSLQTEDIAGARPRARSPSPSAGEEARDPQSPRYKYDTSSMVGTVIREKSRAVAMEYGGFEKRGRQKRAMAAVEEHGSSRAPSSLRTDVERPPEHPNTREASRRRFLREGLQRHLDAAGEISSGAQAEASAAQQQGCSDDFTAGHVPPGSARPTYTTFAHESKRGRNTNPADPVYNYDVKSRPVPPQRRRTTPFAGATKKKQDAPPAAASRPAAAAAAPVPKAPAAAVAKEAAKQRDIQLVRDLPRW